MANNQTNPYLNGNGMGQMNNMGVNPSQIPPALYQQLIASQQNQAQNLGQNPNQNQQQSFARMANNGGGGNANNNGGNGSMGFSGIHETYQRLQSQESAKLEQQRLGMGFPGTAAPGQYQQLLALQSQSNMPPGTNANAMMGALNYPNPQQPIPQQQQQQQPQQQQNSNIAQSQQQAGMNMAAPQNSNMNFAQIQAILQASQQQVSQQHLQQQQQGGQGGNGQGSNALGMGGMGSQMNIHSQNQGLNLQSSTGESEQGRRQMLQGMLQGQNVLSQQQQNMLQAPQQNQQFSVSPNQQNAQMQLPPNLLGGNGNANAGGQSSSNLDTAAQQIEQFFRQNPGSEKDPSRNQAFQQLVARARQQGLTIPNMGSSGPSPGQGQQDQNQGQGQQRQPPHAVGLNGFAGQQAQNSNQISQQLMQQHHQQQQQQQQQQRSMPPQPTPQMPQQQLPQQQQQQMQQRLTNEQQYSLAQQQFQNANMGNNDAQRQIEALQAMKQRQRSGLVTPQMGTANSLPLTSPQPLGQSMQQQQQQIPQSVGSNPSITPAHHHRTLSQSSNIQPQIPRPMPQQQQQQQQQGQQMQPKEGNMNPAHAIHGMTEENLLKVAISMAGKLHGPQAMQGYAKQTLLQLITEFKRRHLNMPQPLIDSLNEVFPGIATNLISLDYPTLQGMVLDQNVKQQQQLRQRQLQMANQGMAQGSQTNPVDITTPALPVMNSNIPQFAQQPAGAGIVPPPPPQRQPSSSGPGSGQTNPQQQQQWQQQQQQLAQNGQNIPQIQQSTNRGKPWAGQDFSKDPFPVPEEKFLGYLAQMLGAPSIQPPLVQGKVVDLYALFNLVHRNGGSVKLEGNVATWSLIAGLAGFGENTQSGPAARSTPNIAIQIAQIHAKYLSKLEDMFYKSLYDERLRTAARAQLQELGGNGNNGNGQSQSQVLPPSAQQQQQHPQISTQFLEAVARGSNSMNMLNDQQRRALEGRKPTGQTPTNQNQNQNQGQGQNQNQIPTQIRQPQSDIGVLKAMRNNPTMASMWVRSTEMQTLQKSRDPVKGPQYGQVPPEVKSRLLSEMAGLPQLAAEAQSKMSRFFMVAVERNTNPAVSEHCNPSEDCGLLSTLISMYTSVQTMMAHAAQDRFLLTHADLNVVRDKITMITNRFTGYTSELYSNPETAQSLAKLIAAVDAAPPAVGPPSLPRQSPAAIEDMASKLPKGLRVEDLKPPPAKRQKGKAGQSPSVQTPDPKTPSVAADSPAPIPGSAQSGKKPTGAAAAAAANNKRKRQASSTAVPKAAKSEVLASMTAVPVKAPQIVQPVEERNEYQILQDTRNALEDGSLDPIDALAAALAEFESAQAEYSARPTAPNGFVANTYGTFPSNGVPQLQNPSSAAGPSAGMVKEPTDDELFNEFLDYNGDPFPIPELLVDTTDDFSPESIRTIGRSDSVAYGQPSSATGGAWSMGGEHQTPSNTKISINPNDQYGLEDEGLGDGSKIEIPQSPASRHYNGPLYFQ